MDIPQYINTEELCTYHTHELIFRALTKKSHCWMDSVCLEAFSCSDFQKQTMDPKHQGKKMEINVVKKDIH